MPSSESVQTGGCEERRREVYRAGARSGLSPPAVPPVFLTDADFFSWKRRRRVREEDNVGWACFGLDGFDSNIAASLFCAHHALRARFGPSASLEYNRHGAHGTHKRTRTLRRGGSRRRRRCDLRRRSRRTWRKRSKQHSLKQNGDGAGRERTTKSKHPRGLNQVGRIGARGAETMGRVEADRKYGEEQATLTFRYAKKKGGRMSWEQRIQRFRS